ncbi:MAG: exonuclease domain-containing protein [Candidatus Baldrarchaeia archaeon]
MRYVIMDLECTCWDRGDKDRQPHEIIEIGACLLDDKYTFIKAFSQFVKPIDNPQLTEYCTDLTTITQLDIDTAPRLSEAIIRLVKWVGNTEDVILCSWGYFDKEQLLMECQNGGIDYPFTDDHINVKMRFVSKLGCSRRMGLKKALRYLGMQFEGTPHRAISDAIMTAKILKFLMTEKWMFNLKKKLPIRF